MSFDDPSFEEFEFDEYQLSEKERNMLAVLEQIPIHSPFGEKDCLPSRSILHQQDYEYVINKWYYFVGNAPSDNKVANKSIALFLSKQIEDVSGIFDDWNPYLPELLALQENFSKLFWKGDEAGYLSFQDNIVKIVYPFPHTDDNVCKGINKLLNRIFFSDITIFNSSEVQYIKSGELNGLFRKCIEVIEEWPEKFISFPELITATPKIQSVNLIFEEIFKSPHAYEQCIMSLEHEFFKEGGKIWDYKKSPKTAFIALRDVLLAKGYLVKRISDADVMAIAKNTFGMEISFRTFKEYESIRKAYSLFRILPPFKS